MNYFFKFFLLFLVVFLLNNNYALANSKETALEKRRDLFLISFKDEKDPVWIQALGGKVIRDYGDFNILLVEVDDKIAKEIEKDNKISAIVKNIDMEFSNSLQKNVHNGIYRNMGLNTSMFEKGTGINIAIIDSGIDKSHKELMSSVKGGANCSLIELDNKKEPTEYICPNLDSFSNDINGHGTHVSGIVKNLAPNANLFDVQVTSNGSKGVSLENFLAGLKWVYDKNKNDTEGNKIDIINMSLGYSEEKINDFPKHKILLKNTLQLLSDQGVVLVAAAGNSSKRYVEIDNLGYPTHLTKEELKSTYNVDFPAYLYNVISVGNVDWSRKNRIFDTEIFYDDRIISYDLIERFHTSSVGKVDITAFGSDMCSLKSSKSEVSIEGFCNDGETYHYMTGTSMAAPVVTGILALYKERYPKATPEELKNMLYEQATDLIDDEILDTHGKDKYFGYGLANPNPPKYHLINEDIALNKVLPVYAFANLQAPVHFTIDAGTYTAIMGKNWNNLKQRFEFYFIENYGWVRLLNDDEIEVDSTRQELPLNKYYDFYDEKSTLSTNVRIYIEEKKVESVLTDYVTDWDKTLGNYEWAKVSIPEYNIKDKWIKLSSRKNIYTNGVFDTSSINMYDLQNVTNYSYFTDNNLDNFIKSALNSNGYVSYKLDYPVLIDHVYFKHEKTSSNSLPNLSIEFRDKENNLINTHQITEQNLDNEYFNVDPIEASFITLKNDGNSVNVIEFELFGKYKHATYEEYEPIQNFNLNNLLFSSYYSLYNEPRTETLYQSNVYLRYAEVELVDMYGWNYEEGRYAWIKVNVPELNIYNKWMRYYEAPYTFGVLDNFYNKIVKNSNVTNPQELFNNSMTSIADSKFVPGSSITIRLDQGINNIDNIYIKPTTKLSYSETEIFKITAKTNSNRIIEKKLSQKDLVNNFGELNFYTFPYLEEIKYLTIENISNQNINIKEIEFFDNEYKQPKESKDDTIKKLEKEVVLNGYLNFYKQPFDLALKENKLILNILKTEKVKGWNSEIGNYKWLKLNLPDIDSTYKWFKNTIHLYKFGLFDQIGGNIFSYKVNSPELFIDNALFDFSSTTLKPDGYIRYQFNTPIKIEQIYLNHLYPLKETAIHLKLNFITNNDEEISYSVTEDDLFYELFDVDLKDKSIKYLEIKNTGDNDSYITEMELYGSIDLSENSIVN